SSGLRIRAVRLEGGRLCRWDCGRRFLQKATKITKECRCLRLTIYDLRALTQERSPGLFGRAVPPHPRSLSVPPPLKLWRTGGEREAHWAALRILVRHQFQFLR